MNQTERRKRDSAHSVLSEENRTSICNPLVNKARKGDCSFLFAIVFPVSVHTMLQCTIKKERTSREIVPLFFRIDLCNNSLLKTTRELVYYFIFRKLRQRNRNDKDFGLLETGNTRKARDKGKYDDMTTQMLSFKR